MKTIFFNSTATVLFITEDDSNSPEFEFFDLFLIAQYAEVWKKKKNQNKFRWRLAAYNKLGIYFLYRIEP